MRYFLVKLYRFNNKVIYLNKKENKVGTIEEPYKFYYDPIEEYEEITSKYIIISVDQKGIAHEIITNIEIPIIFKDEIITYNYDTFNYVKTFDNAIISNNDIHTFSVLNRTIFTNLNHVIYKEKQPTYEEVIEYLNLNKNKEKYKKELEAIFENNLEQVINYKNKLNNQENDRIKIKNLIKQLNRK